MEVENKLEFTPEMFCYWGSLERYIYKMSKNNPQYCYAHTKGVRMLLVKHNGDTDLYYCTNSKGISVIPEMIESVKNGDYLKTKYEICKSIDNSINFFVDNIGKDDIVRTHTSVIETNNFTDKELIEKISKIFK